MASFIESLIPSLVPSEQRVARAFVDPGIDVSLMSAADVAALASTSAATVIRTCQSLGFKGFQHLRLLLLRDRTMGPSQQRLEVSSGEGATRGWLPSLFRMAGESLSNVLGPLDFDELERAVSAIANGGRLLIVGNGGSAPIAQMSSLEFVGIGRANEAPVDAVHQQLTARSLGAGDVCLCISGSGANSVTLRAAEAASRTEATVIGLSGFQRSRLDEYTDLSLVCTSPASAWANGLIAGNVAHFLFVGALAIAVAAAKGRPEVNFAVMDEIAAVLDAEIDQTPDSRD